MRRPFRSSLPALTALLFALTPLATSLPFGCSSTSELQLCGQIPGNGCPVGRGGTCEDQSCDALYDCVEGSWRLFKSCPNITDDAGSSQDAAETPDSCSSIVVDHTGETTGCKPNLQNPDCPAVAAETCPETACLTDCLDFYLCMKEGWALVAYCNEEGQVVLTP